MGHCFSKSPTDDDEDTHVELNSKNVIKVSTIEDWNQKLADAETEGKIVIANFSATWCGPCRVIAPYYADLSEQHPELMFLVVDVDELTDFSESWDIKATPTFFFIKDGRQLDKLVGANRPELERKVTAIVDSIQDPSTPK